MYVCMYSLKPSLKQEQYLGKGKSLSNITRYGKAHMAGLWTTAVDQIVAGVPIENIRVTCPYCQNEVSFTDCMMHLRDEHIEYYMLMMAIVQPAWLAEYAEPGDHEPWDSWDSYESLLELCDQIGYEEPGVTDINAVSTVIYAADLTENAPERCVICLEDLRATDAPLRQMTKCKHCFHANCIEQWLSKKKTCVVCMQCLEA